MRLIFMGSGAFALPTLRWLSESEHEVVAVVTQPARGSGRGQRVTRTPVRAVADELGLTAIEPENVNDDEIVEQLRAFGADLALVIAFGQKIRQPLRDALPGGCINLHASLLPKYRGAAPINWAIANGEANSGCTVFQLVDRMDAGPILSMTETPIGSTETAGELHDRLAELGIETVQEALTQFADGKIPTGTPQDDALATPARKLSKDDGNIDFDKPARIVAGHIHGMTPWPGARAKFISREDRWENVTILRAQVVEDAAAASASPGSVLEEGRIATRDAAIEVLEIKPSSGRVMTWRDYANGRQVAPGDRFTSPGS
jgi:methionyl-tRNA formyltransferase